MPMTLFDEGAIFWFQVHCLGVGQLEAVHSGEIALHAREAENRAGDEEENEADHARFPFEKAAQNVEDGKHDLVLQVQRIGRLRDEQHRYKPLQAVHLR